MVPDSQRLRTAARTFLTAPASPQTYRNLLYVLLGFPMGLAYFVVISVGVSVGVGLLVVVVGVAILGVVVLFGLVGAGVERWLVAALVDGETGGQHTLDGGTRRERLRSLVTDWRTWSPLVYLPLRFAVGTVGLVVAGTVLSTGLNMLLIPLYYTQTGVYVGVPASRPVELHPALYIGWNNLIVGFETVFSVGYWRVESLPAALLVAVLGLGLCLVALALVNALARLSAWLTRRLVGGSLSPVSAFRRARTRG